MAVALETFVKHLAESGVIAPGKLEHFVPPKAHPKDAQELARQLVRSNQLTKFQAQEIYLGRAKSLILGNYTILDKIGAGGMGQVFKAEHRRMKRIVAIKMLPEAVTQDAAAVARFQREVEAAARLRHPNIVAADDADEAGGVHFLVMEYVEGSDLSALVKKHGPLSVAKAVNYMLQAARGLEFAHKKGVIHRDVKPGNLLLDTEGTVKILDMGLARLSSDGNAATQAELTGTGAALGTVDYMAPEQAVSTKHADARADIYGLGCSLHYLLTGKATYDGETLMAKLLAHRESPIPSLGADVPEEVQAVFEKMVAKTVEDRYQTMSEVVAALEACISGQQASLGIQQPVDAGSRSDVLSFLRNVTLNTIHKPKPKPTKKPAATKTGKGNKQFILGAIGAAFLGLAVLAVIFKMQTKDGTLVVEVNQPDAVVQVLDAEGKVEISQPGEKGTISISVDPGKHRLKVEKDGFQFFAKDFEMETGGTQSIKATLVPLEGKTLVARTTKPLAFEAPSFQQWMKDVAAMPAEKQMEAVVKKLQELNPAFDGKETHKIGDGVVTELYFCSDNVTDVSPVRALERLRFLNCDGNSPHKGKLFDLSPLKGMKLTFLSCGNTQVSDLSPLEEMPLTFLNCSGTQVSDLLPLKGMPLKFLNCSDTQVSDLSPLKGMPLTNLWCYGTSLSDLSPLKGLPLIDLNCSRTRVADLSPLKEITLTILQFHSTPVSDLSPLKGMPLTKVSCEYTAVSDLTPLEEMHLATLCFTPKNITRGTEVIRQMPSLKRIGTSWEDKDQFSPVEFWKKYDAREFGKPTTTGDGPYPQRRIKEGVPPPAVAPFDATKAKEHQTAWAKHLGVPVEITNSIGMKLVLVPPGEFQMGSPKELIEEELKAHGDDQWYQGRLPGEGPQHRVRITKPFYFGVYLVTQGEYQRVMGANPSEFSATGKEKDKAAGQDTKRFPVENVSWDDAVEFCRKLSDLPEEKAAGRTYLLPSEAQWEYACRAGSTGRFSFSSGGSGISKEHEEKALSDYGWFSDNAGGMTHVVGGKRASAWGLYDMQGNVWEWCEDWYDKDYYAKSPTDDPTGPLGGSLHVDRGGGWYHPARYCRSAGRNHYLPGPRVDDLGFRVSRVLTDK